MITLYKPSDKVPVKIGDFVFYLSPLSLDQYLECMNQVQMKGGEEQTNYVNTAILCMKYAVKGFEGDVKFSDGSKFELSFGDDGCLTDDSVLYLLRLDKHKKLFTACIEMLNKDPDDINIPGVEFNYKAGSVKKKKVEARV